MQFEDTVHHFRTLFGWILAKPAFVIAVLIVLISGAVNSVKYVLGKREERKRDESGELTGRIQLKPPRQEYSTSIDYLEGRNHDR